MLRQTAALAQEVELGVCFEHCAGLGTHQKNSGVTAGKIEALLKQVTLNCYARWLLLLVCEALCKSRRCP